MATYKYQGSHTYKIDNFFTKHKKNIILLFLLIALSFITVILVQRFILCSLSVNNHSMMPYLKKNSVVFGLYAYMVKLDRHNIIYIDNTLCRIVGLPKENIQIVAKQIIINGTAWNDIYAYHPDNRIFPKNSSKRDYLTTTTLSTQEYFCLPDNRSVIYDLRRHIITRTSIIAKIVFKTIIGNLWL